MGRKILGPVLSLVGALVGAFLGTMACRWLLMQGYYARVFPGAAMGLGCCMASLERSWVRGAICGVGGILVGLLAEWQICRPWQDESLSNFVQNLPKEGQVTFLMVAVGGIFAFWWGKDAAPWIGRISRKPYSSTEA